MTPCLEWPDWRLAPPGKAIEHVREEPAEIQAPPVCPGCHAVGEEPCLSGCIDAEIEAEHRHAVESGDYQSMDDLDAEGELP